MDIGARDSALSIATLVEIARTVEGQEALAEAICAHAVAALGLAGASIGLVRGDEGKRHLESIAAVGQLSPFIRDMSTPLGTATDATKTALGGEPIFVGNPHGVSDGGDSDGVARWRNGFGSHAYAVLALNALEGTIGVLTLEWPEPQTFAADTRDSIHLFADVAALVLREGPRSSPPAFADAAPRRSCQDAETAAFEASARGLVVPVALAASWEQPPVAHIWTAATSNAAAGGATAFADVVSVPSGGFMLVVAGVSAGTGGSAAAASGRRVTHTVASHGSSPREVLGMLGSSMRSESPGAWTCGLAAAFHPASGAMEIAEAGPVAVLTLHPGGRFEVVRVDAGPGAHGRPEPSRIQLLLPGDRVALLSGRIAALADPACEAEARRALAAASSAHGADAAATLLSLVCADDAAAAVAVLQIAESPNRGSE
jgi:hypothetical protein